ncbi:MAG: DNA polymerase III subunit epsilon [Gammaproteobacteria bacterium]|nr:DNA polymerase III subunit epsilon [Gammaproteobacteria bacterium]MDH5653887.1 DNA polymerase III subunit epsilon [Gammaproteobacteria bacterium]
MRQIVLDTETTGLEPAQGHRIIEIGCVELVNRRITKNNFHQYINPEREIDEGAIAVHGITNEFLVNKPVFRDIVADFLDFIRGAELIIHNAPFDVGFINNELNLLQQGLGKVDDFCGVLDTLIMARKLHPGQKNNLDALCRRYDINNAHRELHGALLDAEILADVYLAMTGGQTALSFSGNDNPDAEQQIGLTNTRMEEDIQPGLLRVIKASEAELAAHQQRLDEIAQACGGDPVWRIPAAIEE